MKREGIIEIVCILLILLFVYAASSKLIDLKSTYREMHSQPFPNWMTIPLVWSISILELTIAGLLLFDRTKKIGLWGSFIVMTLFSGYIGVILLGLFTQVPCSCGGVIKKLGWIDHLYFNLFFVVISGIALLILHNKKRKTRYMFI